MHNRQEEEEVVMVFTRENRGGSAQHEGGGGCWASAPFLPVRACALMAMVTARADKHAESLALYGRG